MLGVIDYGAGNLGSVMNALKALGFEARIAAGPEELSSDSPFRKIIFPGDGHFATAMISLEKTGYVEAIKNWIRSGRPFLGICIGLQLLFDSSEEAIAPDGSSIRGLEIIPGQVKLFPGPKVPQIGWNSTRAPSSSNLFNGVPQDSYFYYIHSYCVDPKDKNVSAAETEYYLPYCSAVELDNLTAVQFHPEKSGKWGLKLLNNWAEA